MYVCICKYDMLTLYRILFALCLCCIMHTVCVHVCTCAFKKTETPKKKKKKYAKSQKVWYFQSATNSNT